MYNQSTEKSNNSFFFQNNSTKTCQVYFKINLLLKFFNHMDHNVCKIIHIRNHWLFTLICILTIRDKFSLNLYWLHYDLWVTCIKLVNEYVDPSYQIWTYKMRPILFFVLKCYFSYQIRYIIIFGRSVQRRPTVFFIDKYFKYLFFLNSLIMTCSYFWETSP